MKIVEAATNAPGQCLVSQDIDGPFIDTECWAPWADPYVYLSKRWVEEVARDVLDMIPRQEVAQEIKEMQAEIEALVKQCEDLAEFAESTRTLERQMEAIA